MNEAKNRGEPPIYTSFEKEEIMNYCEQYREQLIRYCSMYFDYDYDEAKDRVQNAYVALLENLNNSIKINNYKAWLYCVVLNYKNKAIKNKIKRNEANFPDSDEKERAIQNAKAYNPDYTDLMIDDKTIEKRAICIISRLKPEEKELYISYYIKHKKLKDIAIEKDIKYATVRKRHEKLKKKLKEQIKSFEDE